METHTKISEIRAVNSAGQPCRLIITEFWRVERGDIPTDTVTILDHATCATEDGQLVVPMADGKLRTIRGAEFTSDDPRAPKFQAANG